MLVINNKIKYEASEIPNFRLTKNNNYYYNMMDKNLLTSLEENKQAFKLKPIYFKEVTETDKNMRKIFDEYLKN
jgi:hypothetical protein